MPPNEASHCAALASSTTGTMVSKQQDRSLAGSKEGHNDSFGESGAVSHALKDSVSITGTVARGAGNDEYDKTSKINRQKPGLINRPSPGKDADGDGKARDGANHRSDQSVRVLLHLCCCYANPCFH